MFPWLAIQVPIVFAFHYVVLPSVSALPSPYPLVVILVIVVVHSVITYAAAAEEAREPHFAVRMTFVIAGLNTLLLLITGSEPVFAILIPGTFFYVVLAFAWSTMQA